LVWVNFINQITTHMFLHKKSARRALAFTLLSTLFSFNLAQAQMVDISSNASSSALSHDGGIVYVNYFPYEAFATSIYEDEFFSPISNGSFDQLIINHSSYDGSVAVGSGIIGVESYPGERNAVKYENGVITNIGNLGGDFDGAFSEAFAVSGDGSIIVGHSFNADDEQHAFKYENNVMTDLGTLGGGNYSSAYGISGSGDLVVGSYNNSDGYYRAFKYQNNLMEDVGTLGGSGATATNVSYDGSVIIGGSSLVGDSESHAFKYTEEEGLVDLGTLGGDDSYATSLSYSGKVIVGYSDLASNLSWRGFKYTEEGGMVDLGTLGGSQSFAAAVSHDGSVITGWADVAGDAETHAFIIRSDAVDQGAGPNMVDVNNTVAVLSNNAIQLNSVLNLNETLLKSTLSQDAKIFGKNNLSLAVGARYLGVKSSNSKNDSAEVGGTLKLAYRVNSHFRAGVFIDQGGDDKMPDNFKTRREMPMVGVFATLGENADDLGFSLQLAAAYNNSDLQITRDVLANTEAGSGSANLVSRGAMAQLAYGFKPSEKIMIQPYFGVRFTDVKRDSYVETSGADFPISFDLARKKSTTGLVGIKAALSLSDRVDVKFGLGLERDLKASLDGYAGDISYLGSFDLTPEKIKEVRASGNVGFGYRVRENQQLGLDLFYFKQSVNSSDAAVVYLNYTVGF
jgi:probable HAF family extracellular repeat protein